ncbi:MAG: hypothetical protein ACKOB0_01600, partial [Chthoniobacterales bacterium]
QLHHGDPRDEQPRTETAARLVLLINGKGDEMLYEGGYLRTEGLPFAALKQRALINSVAREAFQSGDFSGKIRAGRPEFAAGS